MLRRRQEEVPQWGKPQASISCISRLHLPALAQGPIPWGQAGHLGRPRLPERQHRAPPSLESGQPKSFCGQQALGPRQGPLRVSSQNSTCCAACGSEIICCSTDPARGRWLLCGDCQALPSGPFSPKAQIHRRLWQRPSLLRGVSALGKSGELQVPPRSPRPSIYPAQPLALPSHRLLETPISPGERRHPIPNSQMRKQPGESESPAVGIQPADRGLYSFSPTYLAIRSCKLGKAGDFCLAKVMQREGN